MARRSSSPPAPSSSVPPRTLDQIIGGLLGLTAEGRSRRVPENALTPGDISRGRGNAPVSLAAIAQSPFDTCHGPTTAGVARLGAPAESARAYRLVGGEACRGDIEVRPGVLPARSVSEPAEHVHGRPLARHRILDGQWHLQLLIGGNPSVAASRRPPPSTAAVRHVPRVAPGMSPLIATQARFG